MENYKNLDTVKILRRILISASLLFTFSSLLAQTVGNNNVIITRGFTPTLNDANKIQRNPEIKDTIYKNPKFDYSIKDAVIVTPFEVSKINAARMKGEPLNKLYKDYIAVGFGNYTTPYVEFFHSSLRSRDTKFGIHLRHLSSAGSIEDYAYPGFSDNLIETYYTKIYKKSLLKIDAKYQRNVVHFYGFEPSLIPDSILVPADNDIKQAYNLGEVKATWDKFKDRPKEADYKVDLKYHYLQDAFKTAENVVELNSRFDWRLNLIDMFTEQRLGAHVNYSFYNNSWDSITSRNSSLIHLEPFYKFRYRTLKVKFGLAGDIAIDSVTTLNFYPHLDMKLEAIKNILYFNFSIAGEMRKNTLKEYSDVNPFISSDLPMDFTNYKYQVNFGLGSTISRELDFNLQLHYNSFEHAPLFITDYRAPYNNTFKVVYDDYDEVRLHAGFAWQKQEKLRMMLSADYFIYNMTNELFAWHKPEFIVKASANYNIGNKILFKVEINANGASKALVSTDGVLGPQTIKPWLDANVGVEYRYRKKLGIFLNINNISASQYYRYYNYPSYRFNILGGVSYIF